MKHEFSPIGFKRFQFPTARHEIEKLPAIGEADEILRANDARRQAIRKASKQSREKILLEVNAKDSNSG